VPGYFVSGRKFSLRGPLHSTPWLWPSREYLGDLMVWILLGLEKAPTAKEIDRRAERAATVFVATYGR
jgi:hypothetical protein